MSSEPTISKLFDLTGKVALITGASGHLGSAMSRALSEAGATVVKTSRRESADSIQIDYMDENSIKRGFESALTKSGRIDILINNGHDALASDWTDVTADQFNHHLANATGYFLLSRLVRDHAVARKSSASIIMLASMYGSVGSYPDAYEGIGPASPVAYHALKGGILQMTRHLAVYWAKDNVRVNALSPGPFPSRAANQEMVERLKTKSPMKRMGEPHELKGAVVFLASDASSYMTGQNLIIDGGWTAW